MTPILRKLTYIALVICMITLLVPTTTVNAKEQSDPITPGLGYSFLKSDRQRIAYMRIAEALLNSTMIVDISDISQTGEDLQDIDLAISIAMSDFSECFWAGSGYSCDSEHVYLRSLITTNFVDPYSIEMISAQEQFREIVNQIVTNIPSDVTSDKEIAAYLWEYIRDHCKYGYSNAHQTAYGALVLGEAVCAGFAHAYSCLLKVAGIESMVISGFNSGGRHAWNLVKLDGQYYYADCLNAAMFMSLDKYQEDFTLDPCFDIIPPLQSGTTIVFTELDGNPFPSNYGYAQASDNTKANEILSRFVAEKQSDGTINDFHCIILFSGNDWDGWVRKTVPEIANLLGFDDSYQYLAYPHSYTDNVENSYWVSIWSNSGVSDEFPVSDILLNHSSLLFTNELQSVQLEADVLPLYAQNTNITYVSSNSSVANVDANTGIITPVGNGSATISAIAENNGLTRYCEVTVNLHDTHTHIVPLRKVATLPATCKINGHATYYVCDACWQWFADENGAQPIKNKAAYLFPATGHNFPDNWSADEYGHHKQCSLCAVGQYSDGSIYEEHSDSNNDGACDICNYGAQSTTTPSPTKPNQTTPTQKPTTPTTTPPTQQTSPSDTTDPSETTTPSNPTNPTDSTVPSVPTSQPTIPSDPTENTSSSDPSNPSVESAPETSATPSGTTTSENPEPGNDDHPNSTWIIYVALLLGVGGIISYLIYKRKVKSP